MTGRISEKLSSLTYYSLFRLSLAAAAGLIILAAAFLIIRMVRSRKFLFFPTPGVIVMILLALASIAAGMSAIECGERVIAINEIAVEPPRYFLDGTATVMDYIEIRNDGCLANSLNGCWLSDDAENLKKLFLAGYVVPAGGIRVFALGKVPFGIGKRGETVYLSNDRGDILQQVTWPSLSAGEAYACDTEDVTAWRVTEPTPGTPNIEAPHPTLDPPVFSCESGFYDEAFSLTMTAGEGEKIYYTTDGSRPSADAQQYTSPVTVYDRTPEPNVWNAVTNITERDTVYIPPADPVDKAAVIRAVAVNDRGEFSDVRTAVYFVGETAEKYRDRTILCIIADPEELFGDDGIYVTGKAYDAWVQAGAEGDPPKPNFELNGPAWEIPARLTAFSGGNTLMEQNIGLRVQGFTARLEPKKRFSVYAREKYSGSDIFDAPVVGQYHSHALMTKNSFLDTVIPRLIEDRDVLAQTSAPGTVFVNGEFWYDTFLLEKFHSLWFAEHLSVPEEELILLHDFEEPAEQIFLNPMDEFLATHDLADPADYEELSRWIDIQSYIDYVCIQSYIANYDFKEYNNVWHWRTRMPLDDGLMDGRWRWVLYDLDKSTGDPDSPLFEKYSMNNDLWKGILRNEEFRKQLVSSYREIVDTCFSKERIDAVLAEEDFPDEDKWRLFLLRRKASVLRQLEDQFG